MVRSTCPECDTRITFSSSLSPKRGDRTICPKCLTQLVVFRENPIELDWAFIEPFEVLRRADVREGDLDEYLGIGERQSPLEEP